MRILRKIFGGISLTAAMFVFQACYGTMSSMEPVEAEEIFDDSLDEAPVVEDGVNDCDLVMTDGNETE